MLVTSLRFRQRVLALHVKGSDSLVVVVGVIVVLLLPSSDLYSPLL